MTRHRSGDHHRGFQEGWIWFLLHWSDLESYYLMSSNCLCNVQDCWNGMRTSHWVYSQENSLARLPWASGSYEWIDCCDSVVVIPLSWLSCRDFVVVISLSWLSCHDSIIVTQLSWLRCRDSIIVTQLSWFHYRDSVVVTLLSWLSCLDSIIVTQLSWFHYRDSVVVIPLSWLNCRDSVVVTLLSWLSCRDFIVVVFSDLSVMIRSLMARFNGLPSFTPWPGLIE